jgi:hypothetical protein
MSDTITYQCSKCGKTKHRDESIGGPSCGRWPQCCGKDMKRLPNDSLGLPIWKEHPIVHSSLRK